MNLPSKLLENAVNEFSMLPGVGKKTALRLVLQLLKERPERSEHFAEAIKTMRLETRFCKKCHNISDGELCAICANPSRNEKVVCVVQDLRDLIAIENTQQFHGTFHILGGIISPIDGIGPDELNIESLVKRTEKDAIEEVIMALNPTMEGDTTVFYLSKKLAPHKVKITTIARGVAFGGELEYVDELTLARSIATRLPYQNYVAEKG